MSQTVKQPVAEEKNCVQKSFCVDWQQSSVQLPLPMSWQKGRRSYRQPQGIHTFLYHSQLSRHAYTYVDTTKLQFTVRSPLKGFLCLVARIYLFFLFPFSYNYEESTSEIHPISSFTPKSDIS